MNKILDKIRAKQIDERKTAQSEYAILLARQDEWSKKDEKRLEAIMVTLGLTADKVAADAQIVKQVMTFESVGCNVKDLEQKMQDAHVASEQFNAEYGKQIAELKEKLTNHRMAALSASQSYENARERNRDAANIREQHPHLFDKAFGKRQSQAEQGDKK